MSVVVWGVDVIVLMLLGSALVLDVKEDGLIWCVAVVLVIALVVIVDGLNVLLTFLNIMALRFGSGAENVFSSNSTGMVFPWLVMIRISDVMLLDDSSGPVLGGLLFVIECILVKQRPTL